MILKTGTLHTENNGDKDAVWEYEEGYRVIVKDEEEFQFLSIDPVNLIAIADAIRCEMERAELLRQKRNVKG